MPRVPTYDDFQAGANTLPQAHLTARPMPGLPTPPEIPDTAGAQARQMGRAMFASAQQVGDIAIDMQRRADLLRVDDATNRVKEAALRLTYDKDVGFSNLKGITALERPDGKPLADEYSGTLQQHIDEIAGTLGNDTQRQAFARQAATIAAGLRGHAMQHEAQEFKTYGLSVAEGVQSTALREISLSWRNPDAVDAAVERIRAETYRQAQLLGKSAEWQDAQSRKLTSHAHKTALLAALEQNDASYADAYLRKRSGQMDADDILAVRAHITKAMDARVGFAAAGDAIERIQPRLQVNEAERAFNIALMAESGGRQFDASGRPLTSPKGAIGIAQVMPETAPEAAKLAGLPWDEQRYRTDPAYNKAIGLAYFQQQLQDNGGDVAKAYAAYNAGPGRLQKAIQKAEQNNKLAKNDPSIPVRSYLDFLPAETKAYVTKNIKAFDAGQGQPPRATFQEVDEQLRADPRLADNPARYKLAREEAEHRFTEQVKALQQRDAEAVAVAMRGLIENGGRYSALPASVRAAVPAKEADNLIAFGQKIAKGDDTTSPWLYAKLANNPDKLARMSDDEFFALRRELSDADFKHFANERAKRNGSTTGGDGPGDLNSQAVKQSLDARLRTLKIDPSPKDDGGDEAARIGGIRRFVDRQLLTAQREAGKKFTDAEVEQHLDALFAKNATFRGFFTNSSGPMLAMKAGDIDSAVKSRIKAAFKRQGVDDPTDAQILDIYWKSQLVRK